MKKQLCYGSSVLLLTLAASAQAAAPAAETDKAPWTFNFYFENDVFANTDRSYTNGLRLSWVSPDIDNYLYDPDLPDWLRDVNRWFVPIYPIAEDITDDVKRNLVFTIGQQMYTPNDRERTDIINDDRPYAGWLYAGFGYHAKTANKLNSVELNLGIVGPAALARETQNFTHRLINSDLFRGWDNQLKNEPGIQLVYEHKNRLAKQWLYGNFGYDFIVHGGGSLGNVATYLNTGAEVRLGFDLPDDFGTSALRPGGDNSAPGDLDSRNYQGWGAHAFVSLDGRWVLHNIFLDGNSYRDSHSVDKKHFVADMAFGVAVVYHNWKVSYAHIHRTKEFASQRKPQRYGSLTVSYSY